jgi:iron complex outermembrane receptor protein
MLPPLAFRRALFASAALVAFAPALALAQTADPANAPAATAPPVARDAAASDATADDAASATNSNSLEEVIVTARHVAENLQDVPESVQAISGATLERKNTVSLSDLVSQTPGLFDQIGNPRNTSLAISGVGVTSSAGDGLDNMVGVYFDGVYQGRPGMALQDLIDIDSFEVLRGPQGALFGRNSEVGALNITTQAPSFTPSENFEFSSGNYSFEQGKAILTGPINDKVAFRTVLFATFADGWLPNQNAAAFASAAAREGITAPTATDESELSSQGRYGIRQKFLIDATDRLNILVEGDWEQENDSQNAGTEITQLFGPGAWGPNTTAAQQAKVTDALASVEHIANFGGVRGWTPKVNPTTDIGNSLERLHTTNAGTSVTVNYKFDWATLTSITAWRYWYFYPPQDSDGSPLDIYYNAAITKDNQWSEELRLTSNDKGPIDWQTGIYLYDNQLNDHYIVHQFGADVIPLYDALVNYGAVKGTPIPLSLRPLLTGAQVVEDTHVKDQNAAVYSQGTWHITDRLSVTGGGRYTYDSKSGSSPIDLSGLPLAVRGAAVTAGAASTLANFGVGGATAGYPLNAKVSDGNFSGTASLSYKFTPDTLLYGLFSSGYQAAALNLNAVIKTGVPVVVNPSNTDNYEVGVKSSLFDRRVTLDVGAYWETLDNYQTTYSQIEPNGSALRYVANAGNLLTRGFEWDLAAALGGGVRLSFDGAYNNAYFTSAPSVAPPPEVTTPSFDATAHAAPDAPTWTLSVTPSWDHQISAHTSFYSYAQYSYSSSFYSATNLSAYSLVPGQYTLNLRAGFQFDDGKYDISLFANNATDQRNILSRALLALPTTSIYYAEAQALAPPAMYGVTLKAKFN